MLVGKLTGYVLLYPLEIEAFTGTAANTLSALTSSATGTASAAPVEPEPEPEAASVRLIVTLIGTERRTIALTAGSTEIRLMGTERISVTLTGTQRQTKTLSATWAAQV
jgi:hypothetical protein